MSSITKFSLIRSLLVLLFLSFCLSSAIAQDSKDKKDKKDPDKERKEIQKIKNEALSELYKLYPEAKAEIAQSKGYAAFGNTGVNLLVLATGRGGGVAHSNVTGKDTYMKMISAGVGVGIGYKKYFAIFIFSTTDAFNHFIEQGWTAEGQSDAAAKTNEQGDAVSAALTVAPGVILYQVTDVGFAAQATIQGTKFVVDEDLN